MHNYAGFEGIFFAYNWSKKLKQILKPGTIVARVKSGIGQKYLHADSFTLVTVFTTTSSTCLT